jgi:sphinganine-1-phosphate aldolase
MATSPTAARARLTGFATYRLRNVLLALFLLRWTRRAFYTLKGRGPIGSVRDAYVAIRRILYGWFLRMPGVRGKVQAEVSEAITKIEGKLVPHGPGVDRFVTLPKDGWDKQRLEEEMGKLSEMKHSEWERGMVSGAVYHGGKELLALQTEAFGKFTVANPIHPDAFPGVRKMEAEVVAMVSCSPNEYLNHDG